MGVEQALNKGHHSKLTLENKILPPLLPGFELANLSITSPVLFTNKLSQLMLLTQQNTNLNGSLNTKITLQNIHPTLIQTEQLTQHKNRPTQHSSNTTLTQTEHHTTTFTQPSSKRLTEHKNHPTQHSSNTHPNRTAHSTQKSPYTTLIQHNTHPNRTPHHNLHPALIRTAH